ncbi:MULTISPECIES: AI-2E family transporter [unclassified Acidocella]|uniref:AI-2E family transporter n=1 Tax=unclassified Acidocella TaxID=2648610 RepID=UPI000685BE03|nr:MULTISPECIES: AI-2E family transporter [unclassified Acidocella]WBO58476.1 AI-2E family transporter [Acidocella sp. MX-AZ03]
MDQAHDNSRMAGDGGLASFAKRVLIVALFAALAVAAWRLADLGLLLFGAVLIAIGLRRAACGIGKWTRIGPAGGLAVAVLVFLVALAAALSFFGTVAAGQFGELARQVPLGSKIALDWLRQQPYGPYILTQARGIAPADVTGMAGRAAAIIVQSTVTTAGYAILVFLVAIYLAAQPDLYRRLLLRLVPPGRRAVAARLYEQTGQLLLRWLLGQFIVMLTIGILSGLGLWALGIEAPVALGLVGGLLTFIPYFGAVMAAVPATLVALTQSPLDALWVIAMYAGVHFIEGNFITPLVQAEATALPPVLSLLSTVGFSILFGISAVLLATPLMLLVLVIVEILYVETILGAPPPRRAGSLPVPEVSGPC